MGITPAGHHLRDRRRHPRRQEVQGGADRRALRRLHPRGPARPRGRLRRADQGRLDDGLGRHDRHGRRHLHGRRRPVLHRLPHRRVLRQVRPLPRGPAADAQDPDEHHRGQGRTRATSRLWRSSPRPRRRPRCAPWARPRPNPFLSTLRYFRDEYEAHIKEKRCPALSCKELISYYIDPEKCKACLICLKKCPAEAIDGAKKKIHIIDQEQVRRTAASASRSAPSRFDAVMKISGEPVPPPIPEDQRTVIRKSKRTMSEIRMQIDGKEVEAAEGMTVLEAARERGDLDPHALPPREAGALRRLPALHRRGRGATAERASSSPASIRRKTA